MTRPVQIGLIGCGSVAIGCYLPLLERLNLRHPAGEVVIACDRDPNRAPHLKERFGITAFTTDSAEVLGNPAVELVLILTSMREHGALVRAALEAGKHVLVEKPMATTLDEAASLLALAKTSPGHLVCAPHVMLSPTYQAIWRRLHRGEIGRVLTARGFYGWAGPSWGEWYYQPEGGALFDLGVYNVITLTGLLGPAKRVMAMSGVAIPERVVDGAMTEVRAHDNAQILLDFGAGVYAAITTGFTIQKYRCPGIELYGTAGTIQMIGEDWAPRGYELWRNSDGCWRVYDDRGNWPWTDGLRDLIEAIQEDRPPVSNVEHAYHGLEIMIKAMASGETGQAIALDSTFQPLCFDLDAAGAASAETLHDPGRAE